MDAEPLTRRTFLERAAMTAGAVFAFGLTAPINTSDPSSSYGTGKYGGAVYGGLNLRRKRGRH